MLGAPPAFVLSQDQTLNLILLKHQKCYNLNTQNNSDDVIIALLFELLLNWIPKRNPGFVHSHIRYCLIFKFPFRHRSLSVFRESLSVTALLLYHVVFGLSSTFLKFFEKVFSGSCRFLPNFSANSKKFLPYLWRLIQFSSFVVGV